MLIATCRRYGPCTEQDVVVQMMTRILQRNALSCQLTSYTKLGITFQNCMHIRENAIRISLTK